MPKDNELETIDFVILVLLAGLATVAVLIMIQNLLKEGSILEVVPHNGEVDTSSTS